MNRRTAAVLILAMWVGALGWLTERHYLARAGARGEPRWPVPPGSAFHIVRLGERQIGLASQTVDTVAEGLRVVQLMTLDLPTEASDQRRRTSVRLEALYSRGLQLREWRSLELTERGRSSSHGMVYGDSLLVLVTTPEGVPPETLQVRLRRPVILPGSIPLVAASRGLPRPGSRLNLEVFDPLDRELRVERLVVATESLFTVPDSAQWNPTLRRWVVAHADTIRAWRLDADEHGLPVSRWVDGSGMIVLTRYPLGAQLQRSAFELVNTNFRRQPAPIWDTSAAAPVYFPAPPPGRPRHQLEALSYLAPDDTLPT
ncbi:MAG TPA: hypothetical protein VNH46_00760, partial [Gemmatimonadales bacterium]|nr:hypothetical protein [Gemmatimonadales bacterium]